VLEEMRIDAGLENFTELTRHFHVYPDFRGALPVTWQYVADDGA
jgi:hypothetical protein